MDHKIQVLQQYAEGTVVQYISPTPPESGLGKLILPTHPVMIIGCDRNNTGDCWYQCLMITSKPMASGYSVRLNTERNTNKGTSVVVCNHVHTVHADSLRHILGFVSREFMTKCISAYAWYLGLHDNRPDFDGHETVQTCLDGIAPIAKPIVDTHEPEEAQIEKTEDKADSRAYVSDRAIGLYRTIINRQSHYVDPKTLDDDERSIFDALTIREFAAIYRCDLDGIDSDAVSAFVMTASDNLYGAVNYRMRELKDSFCNGVIAKRIDFTNISEDNLELFMSLDVRDLTTFHMSVRRYTSFARLHNVAGRTLIDLINAHR